jgi:hypothetical protein
MATWLTGPEEVYCAMVLGLRDYVRKSGFKGVLISLSGGVDSALTLVAARDALGAEAVRAFMLPSRYTSRESLEDAAACAAINGVELAEIGIAPAVAAFDDMLASEFVGRPPDLTEENIQARIRGLTMMALSNKLGLMLLTTGNKSEMAVGYATRPPRPSCAMIRRTRIASPPTRSWTPFCTVWSRRRQPWTRSSLVDMIRTRSNVSRTCCTAPNTNGDRRLRD